MRILLLVLCSIRFFLPQEAEPRFQWKILLAEKQIQVQKKKTEVIHNQKEYLKAWIALQKDCPTLAVKPPEVNFKKNLIIAFYGGAGTTDLVADSVWVREAALHTRLKRKELNPACPSIIQSSPCVWIVVSRIGWNILKTQETSLTENCP